MFALKRRDHHHPSSRRVTMVPMVGDLHPTGSQAGANLFRFPFCHGAIWSRTNKYRNELLLAPFMCYKAPFRSTSCSSRLSYGSRRLDSNQRPQSFMSAACALHGPRSPHERSPHAVETVCCSDRYYSLAIFTPLLPFNLRRIPSIRQQP